MILDSPGQGGRGVKKGQIIVDALYGWPLRYFIFDSIQFRFLINESLLFCPPVIHHGFQSFPHLLDD